MRRAICTILGVVGVGCVLLFASFSRDALAWAGGSKEELTIGLHFSPWYTHYVRTEAGHQTSSSEVKMFSWSWVVLLVGAGCLKVAWDLRPRKLVEPECSELAGKPTREQEV